MNGDVIRVFTRAAETYDRGASLHRHVAALLAEFLPEQDWLAGRAILEMGCGTGVLTKLLRQRYPESPLYAVDASEGMIRWMRDQFAEDLRVTCKEGDARTFTCGQSFPLVASSSALHWAQPMEITMANLHTLTEAGGCLCAAMMLEGTLGELREIRTRVAPGKVPLDRLPDESRVLAALEGAGFVLTDVRKEIVHARYSSADDFLRTIHAQGLTGGGVSRGALPLTRRELTRVRCEYDRDCADGHGGVYAGYEVLFVAAGKKEA